jgi:hypothetical protein
MLEEEKQLKNGRSASKIQKCDHRTHYGGFSRLFLPKMAYGECLASHCRQNRERNDHLPMRIKQLSALLKTAEFSRSSYC